MLPAVGLQVSGRDDCGDQARRIALYIAKLPQPFAISYGMAVSPIPPPMAPNSPDAFQSARPAAERITEGTQETITNYFAWLQSAMQASPWGNTDLNKKLMSYATETVTAPLNLAQKLSQAENFADVVKIQTEFVRAQTNSFNEHAKEVGQIFSRVATTATKTPAGMST